MNTQMIPFVPITEVQNEARGMNLRETIVKYLYHWPLFVLCICLSTGVAYLYLNNVNPVYEVAARLLIKDQEKGVSTESAMPELDIIRTTKVIDNELEIIKSRGLMNKVVNELQLWTTYHKDERIFDKDVYSTTPLKLALVTGDHSEIKPHVFEIKIVDQNRYLLKQSKKVKEVRFTSRLKLGSVVYQIFPTSNLNQYIGSSIKISIDNPEAATGNYLSRLQSSAVSKLSTVLEIKLQDNVPERGKEILNRLIAAYNNASVQHKNRVTESTLNFINVRLDSLARELNEIEKNVEGFKSSKGLTDIDAKSNFYLQNVQINDAKLNDVSVQLQVIEGVESYVNSPNSSVAPATTGITDEGLARLIEQLVNVKLQRDRLLATTPEGNPAFDPINRQIETLKESIKDHISGIKSSLQATRQQLQAFNSNFEASIRDLPVQERQFINIKRQQGIKEELYVYLLKKQEEAALSYASTLADSRTIDQAFYGSPVSPNAPLTLGIAVLFGLIAPVGLLYGRQIFNDRIISDKEIKDATSAPILAELVNYVSSSPIPLSAGNCGVIAEQFRTLRTNLSYLHDRASGRVTLLTSGMPGEGKSFISSNLGLALASCDRKTVVLELDMRKPGVSKNFILRSESGLTDYLNGTASMEEITQPSGVHPNLFIIKTGHLPESPADLLGNSKLDSLIDWLRFYFNDILIDTPPVHLVADAMIVSRFSDVTLYVIRQAYTRRSELEYIKDLQTEGKLRNLNIVFNGVEMGARYNYKADFNYRYYAIPDDQRRLGLGTAWKGMIKRF